MSKHNISRDKLRRRVYRTIAKHSVYAIHVELLDGQEDREFTVAFTLDTQRAINGEAGDEPTYSTGRQWTLILWAAQRLLEDGHAVRFWLCTDADDVGTSNTTYREYVDVNRQSVQR